VSTFISERARRKKIRWHFSLVFKVSDNNWNIFKSDDSDLTYKELIETRQTKFVELLKVNISISTNIWLKTKMVGLMNAIHSNDNSCQTRRIIQWLGDERAGKFYNWKENLKYALHSWCSTFI
jgi:hypothetical protein